jgi:hypothetical protein
MDIANTVAPKSDQLDAVDLIGGPRTFVIERVSKGNAEQPVNIHLADFPRPWRPSKGMRRVLIAVWGKDASVYAGRCLTLYCDTGVMFGGVAVGGVRISHMSHIEEQQTVPMIVGRGKGGVWKVDPLSEVDSLRAEWRTATPERQAEIKAEAEALQGGQP